MTHLTYLNTFVIELAQSPAVLIIYLVEFKSSYFNGIIGYNWIAETLDLSI